MKYATNWMNSFVAMFLGAALLGTTSAASAAISVANEIDYGYVHGHVIFSNPSFTSVSEGS